MELSTLDSLKGVFRTSGVAQRTSEMWAHIWIVRWVVTLMWNVLSRCFTNNDQLHDFNFSLIIFDVENKQRVCSLRLWYLCLKLTRSGTANCLSLRNASWEQWTAKPNWPYRHLLTNLCKWLVYLGEKSATWPRRQCGFCTATSSFSKRSKTLCFWRYRILSKNYQCLAQRWRRGQFLIWPWPVPHPVSKWPWWALQAMWTVGWDDSDSRSTPCQYWTSTSFLIFITRTATNEPESQVTYTTLTMYRDLLVFLAHCTHEVYASGDIPEDQFMEKLTDSIKFAAGRYDVPTGLIRWWSAG